MLPAPATPAVTDLTGLALELLQVSLEPASPSAGELFDRIVEHVADHVLRAASAATSPCPLGGEPLVLPADDPAQRRREQLLLRRSIRSGRHPANTSSLHEAYARGRRSIAGLEQVRAEVPRETAESLATATSALAGVLRALDAYRRSAVRVQRALAEAPPDVARQAGLAARAERDLMRRMRRAIQASYGLVEDPRRSTTDEVEHHG